MTKLPGKYIGNTIVKYKLIIDDNSILYSASGGILFVMIPYNFMSIATFHDSLTVIIYMVYIILCPIELQFYLMCINFVSCRMQLELLILFLQNARGGGGGVVPRTFLSPAAPKARDGRYCNTPRLSVRPSVRPSVTFSFRTVTQKRIDVFS